MNVQKCTKNVFVLFELRKNILATTLYQLLSRYTFVVFFNDFIQLFGIGRGWITPLTQHRHSRQLKFSRYTININKIKK